MFSRPEIVVPTDVFALRTEALRKSPALAATAFKRDASRLGSQFKKEISKEPPPVPTYRRTHRLSKSWRVEFKALPDGGIFRAVNGTPYKRWVQGANARWFHIQRGWVQESVIVPKYQKLAQERIREIHRTILDPRAGVR